MKNIKNNYFILPLIATLFFATFQSCESNEDMDDLQEDLFENLPDPVEPVDPVVEEPVEVAVFPGEITDASLSCTDEGTNPERLTADISNPVNVGGIDDRSCYSDYSEVTFNDTVYGVYNITDGSNHFNKPSNPLQPRIERFLPRSKKTTPGNYVKFTGTVVILETGDAGRDNDNGTYIIQAKGKHSGGGGSNDPAILLLLAKPVYGTNVDGEEVQVSFDIYSEQIKERGGSGAAGRDVVFLKNVKKGVPTEIEFEVGFRQDPSDATKKIHYVDSVIGGEKFPFVIPSPDRGLESGIRYGAYRVWGGRAQIRWANTTYKKNEIN